MNIIFITAEVTPFSKAGGLADVSGSLPSEIANSGHSVTILSPLYPANNPRMDQIHSTEINGTVTMNEEETSFEIFRFDSAKNNPVHLFVYNPQLFARKGIYTQQNGEGFADNNFRFFFFQKVILRLILSGILQADIVHCNDHHTALLPFFIRNSGQSTATILTVHNFQYQGHFSRNETALLYPEDARMIDKLSSKERSSLSIGCRFADRVNTVSPTYARELMNDPGLSYDLHPVLSDISSKFSGILNGADYSSWNPESDIFLDYHYSVNELSGKRLCKNKLQEYTGFNLDENVPVIGSISRLVESKGFHLILEIIPKLVERKIQLVFLGSGMESISGSLEKYSHQYPRNVFYENGFNEKLAHLIESGSDFFLMPSRFEPCGLNQIYSLKYGTIPIVRQTGGLADTISQWDGHSGNGFLFREYSGQELLKTVDMAIEVWRDPIQRNQLISEGMKADFSWTHSAGYYIQLYHEALGELDGRKTET